MSGTREKLIDLYSRGPVAQVHASGAYQKLCEENEGDRTFDAERKLMEDVRTGVDEMLEASDSYRLQIQCGLRLIRTLETLEKKQLARRLILAGFGGKWSDEARAFFEEKSLFFMEAKDYFLSFTNRNFNHPNQNEINARHRHFIRSALGAPTYDKADLSKRNLVAEAVHYYLRGRFFEGFFYPEHEGNNQDVKAKLDKQCKNTVAFAQLVQAAMFRSVAESPNWCFYEYDLASGLDRERVLFVEIEAGIREDGVSHGFKKWYKNFAAKDSIKLKETRTYSKSVIEENRELIHEKLAEQIEGAFKRIYAMIPD